MKIFLFPEYVCLLYAARKLELTGGLLSEAKRSPLTAMADHVSKLRLALDSAGKMLGLEVDTVANMGAYLSNFGPFVPTAAGVSMLVGCYTIPQPMCRSEASSLIQHRSMPIAAPVT